MTQKSLVYMVIAVAVGYILVSAVPQQVAMYATPQDLLTKGDDRFNIESTPPPEGDGVPEIENGSGEILGLEQPGEAEELSFTEMSRLPELMKWWTIDILVALSIYWVARRRFT